MPTPRHFDVLRARLTQLEGTDGAADVDVLAALAADPLYGMHPDGGPAGPLREFAACMGWPDPAGPAQRPPLRLVPHSRARTRARARVAGRAWWRQRPRR